MSLAILHSRAVVGLDALPITVEIHLVPGLPKFSIVGLPDAAVRESKERVRSALVNSGFSLPLKKIIVNLAPADLPKDSCHFDLPMALGILIADKQLYLNDIDDYEFAGELALSGELRSIQCALPFSLATKRAKKTLIAPVQNADEAAIIQDLKIIPAKNLNEVVLHLSKRQEIASYARPDINELRKNYSVDLSDVRGQKQAKRALEIAAAGAHNLLFIGPPGSGKTMLASRLPTILNTLTEEEAIDVAAVQSICKKFNVAHWKHRPFRSPHHSASSVALVGGGNPPKPGEISLAHYGVLFLDELPEFSRHVLESLREPLETGRVTISRAARQCDFPANFQLVAAMNPCPCGHLGDTSQDCRCTQDQIQRYRSKISGPVLDRIDMHIEVPRLPADFLISDDQENSESSAIIRKRIVAAQQIQRQRQNDLNAKISSKAIDKVCHLNDENKILIHSAMIKLKLTARSYHKILKIARTIADLDQSEIIQRKHLLEAISLRRGI